MTAPDPEGIAVQPPLRQSLRLGIVAAALALILVLAGLFMRAEVVDSEQHFAYAQLLRDLRELDARIDGELMANRLEFSRNYDALTRYTEEARRRVALARQVPTYLAEGQRDAVAAAADALSASLQRKAQAVDDFKRNESVLRNSLAYLPTASASLLDEHLEPPMSMAVSQAIGRYVRSVLVFARSPDEDSQAALAKAAERLAAVRMTEAVAGGRGAHDERVQNLLRHGEVIQVRMSAVDRLMADIFALPTRDQLEALSRDYMAGHGQALDLAARYRTLLYVLMVALAAYLALTFVRLARARRSLEAAHRELSARFAAQQAAEKRLRLHATAFESAHDGITLTDALGNILDVNPAFSRITGWARSEVIGRNPRVLKSGRHDQAFYEAMWRSIAQDGGWHGEIWNRNKYGEVYPELLSISAVRDGMSGELTNYVAVFADIRRLKAQERQLTKMAYYDALTELPNRALLVDRLEQATAQAPRSGSLLAVCYLDLDGFKPINDKWGHEAGDHVLVEIARRLRLALRGGDTVARLGGDEFVLLLLGLHGEQECHEAIQRFLVQIAQPLVCLPEPAVVSASVGVTLFPTDNSDSDTLLRHADQAMYLAKQAGKNGYQLFNPALDHSTRSRYDLVAHLREALRDGAFVLHYQPQVDMRAGKVMGVEALIRWNHPERGLVAPIEFLPQIEDDELIVQLGDWVIKEALAQLARWREMGLVLRVGVNVASRQLQSPDFVEKLKSQLLSYPGMAPYLELELLETAALEDVVKTSKVVDDCQALGVGFSLDDFGTGYSSLTYLKRLPAETIKIDQSFVREILSDHNNLIIVQGVIGLAKAFQRRLIAEGVETPEHGRLLMQINCDLAQGYGIARPMPADELPAWLEAWRPDPGWMEIAGLAWQVADYPLFIAAVEHRNWVAQLVYAAKEGLPVPQHHLEDHRRCQFGIWYDTVGRSRYAGHAQYGAVDAPHRQVHALAQRMDQLWRDGRGDEARRCLPELIASRDAVLTALWELQKVIAIPREG